MPVSGLRVNLQYLGRIYPTDGACFHPGLVSGCHASHATADFGTTLLFLLVVSDPGRQCNLPGMLGCSRLMMYSRKKSSGKYRSCRLASLSLSAAARDAKPDIVVTDVIPPSIVKAIVGGFDDSKSVITSTGDRRPLAVVLKDSENQHVVGGAIGLSSVGLLFLDELFLPERFRGRGWGTTILGEFEREGQRRGCRSAFLNTVLFSGFYARNGWKTVGRIPHEGLGTFRVFMIKRLEACS